MADTTIGISDENWKKLNQMKEKGDGFDDVINKFFNIKLVKEDVFFYLKTIYGVVHFDTYSISGDTLLLVKMNLDLLDYDYVGEFEINGPCSPPLDEIISRVPQRHFITEGEKLGSINDKGDDPFDLPQKWEVKKVCPKGRGEVILLEDLHTEDKTEFKIGDKIEDDFNRYKLVNILSYGDWGAEKTDNPRDKAGLVEMEIGGINYPRD